MEVVGHSCLFPITTYCATYVYSDIHRAMKRKKPTSVLVRIAAELYKRLGTEAKLQKRTRKALVEMALEKFFAQ